MPNAGYPFVREEIARKITKEQGVSVVIASHDTELAAQCADTCSMMFDGQIVCSSDTAEFMRGNSFYTTDKCRMTGGRLI